MLAFHQLCLGITIDNGLGLSLGVKRIKSVGVHGHERNTQRIAIAMTKRKRTSQSEGNWLVSGGDMRQGCWGLGVEFVGQGD